MILGMGASPGVNNILVRAAAEQLDTMEKIHITWVMGGAKQFRIDEYYGGIQNECNKRNNVKNHRKPAR